MSDLRELRNAGEIIDVLGGNQALMKLTRRKRSSNITNWRAAGYFPADTYLVVTREMQRLGYWARPSLWGIIDPDATTARRSDSKRIQARAS